MGGIMSKRYSGAEHHTLAAEHHEAAARHHRQAAKHYQGRTTLMPRISLSSHMTIRGGPSITATKPASTMPSDMAQMSQSDVVIDGVIRTLGYRQPHQPAL
jgi:hypothetical protein